MSSALSTIETAHKALRAAGTQTPKNVAKSTVDKAERLEKAEKLESGRAVDFGKK